MSAGKTPGRLPKGDDGTPDPSDDDSEPDPFDRWFPDQQSQPARDRLIGRIVGGVWIERCIGQGGMGRVYEGLSRDRGHAVAVKVIEPGFASIKEIEALRREAQILGLFDHPCIAPVYAAGTQVIDGREVPYLVMKLIRGARTIVEYAIQEGLNSKQRYKLFQKVCAAVGHGHGKSIIHRDLKPSNVLVDRSGNPFVIDFGVARSLNPELTRLAARDRTGEIPGTYAYMSPEQFAGNPDAVDKRTDVYSLGVILYELLSGQLPYDIQNRNGGEISRIVQFESPTPIERRRPDLKPALARIVRKCLEKRPRDRFADAVTMLSAVKGKLRKESVVEKAASQLRGLSRSVVRHRAILGGVVLGACLALVGERVIQGLWPPPSPAPESKPTAGESKADESPKTPASKAAVKPSQARPTPADPDKAASALAAGTEPTLLGTAATAYDKPTAVDRALKWLADHQLPNGSWSFRLSDCPTCAGKCSHSGVTDDRAGATALALLPFLGRGYTHKEGPYKKHVERGIFFLAGRSANAQGKVYDGEGTMSSQGLASTALSECYLMTQDDWLAQPAQLAVNFIMSAQDQQGGGWRREPGAPADMYTTACQILALKSVNMAYLNVEPQAIKKAVEFLDFVQDDSGSAYGYVGTGKGFTTSAAGLLCRMYLGWKKDNAALNRGVERLAKAGPTTDLFYDYYVTQIMHHMEGEMWVTWNDKMKKMLLDAQQKDGHAAGSWCEGFKQSNEENAGGRVFCTATAALILEVYRRHPIYRGESVDEEFKE